MPYEVVFENSAINDFEKAIKYHQSFSNTKAKRLEREVTKAIKTLEHTPYFRVRYDNVRCLPFGKKLPYMLHFTIDEDSKTVYVFALFNTLQDPEKYPKK